MIDLNCTYDTVYSDIEANNIEVSGTNVDVDIQGGEGKFKFSLTQFLDSALTQETDENDAISLGSDLYFKLSMENPIPELAYSIQGLYDYFF